MRSILVTLGMALALECTAQPHDSTCENDPPAPKRRKSVVYTPLKVPKNPVFKFSPNSELPYAIYLIHDDDQARLNFDKISFNNQPVSYEAFTEKVNPISEQVKELRRQKQLFNFHRYVGMVSVKVKLGRTAKDRFNEHVKACSKSKADDDIEVEKRLCGGLQANSKEGRKTLMSVVAYNIHETQIQAMEVYFINLFGGQEDLGWNSQPGHLEEYKLFKNSPNLSSLPNSSSLKPLVLNMESSDSDVEEDSKQNEADEGAPEAELGKESQ